MTAVLAGLFFAAAFPNPLHKEFVPQAGLLCALGSAFFHLSLRPGFRASFRRGFLSGIIWNGILLYWVALIQEAGPQVAIPGYLFLVFYNSLYPGLVLGLLSWAFGERRKEAALAAPFLWAWGEWLRSWLFSGFPWGVLAQAMAGDRPWLPALSVAGPYGPSYLAVLAGALAAYSFLSGPKPGRLPQGLALAAALLLLIGGLPSMVRTLPRENPPETLRVSLLQGDIRQDQKWMEGSKANAFLVYQSLQSGAAAGKEKPGLILWPEASFNASLELDSEYRKKFQEEIVDRGGVPTLVGLPACLDLEKGLFSNSAQLWLPRTGKSGHYDKNHLVPLGEYVPLADLFPFIRKVAQGGGAGDFVAGQGPVVFDVGGIRAAPSICYELIFPDLVRRGAALGARVLVNLTNDDWYGDTAMPAQHLAFAVLRSVENGLPLARSANTGLSALIDPYKGIVARGGFRERIVVTGELVLNPPGQSTPYTRVGDLFAKACGVIGFFLLCLGRVSQKRGAGLP